MQGAVFAKNHPGHLVSAAEIGTADSNQLVTFRSAQRWVEAERMVASFGAVPIVFAEVGGQPEVRFRALLREVLLEPAPDDPRSIELLEFRPPTTRSEYFWDKNPRTFYVISGCHELEFPLPYRKLLKRDGAPLNDDYRYAYALVVIPDEDDPGPDVLASDLSSPPARVQSQLSRIVRDTALTRRLKMLYDHTCQRCSDRLEMQNGLGYSEAHHLQPLGHPHNGPDHEGNIIVLCPNCHALCDLRAVELVRRHLQLRAGHRLEDSFLAYHNELFGAKTRNKPRQSRSRAT
jgi:5-methylcytosine-specific restriction endonuclease McrA